MKKNGKMPTCPLYSILLFLHKNILYTITRMQSSKSNPLLPPLPRLTLFCPDFSGASSHLGQNHTVLEAASVPLHLEWYFGLSLGLQSLIHSATPPVLQPFTQLAAPSWLGCTFGIYS